MARLKRAEQVARNRDLLLEAARRVFLARGYAGASLDAIADEAGFSVGVVYSQFGSKADLFFALLERRIETRALQNDRIAKEFGGADGLRELLRAGREDAATAPGWQHLLRGVSPSPCGRFAEPAILQGACTDCRWHRICA